MSVSTGLYSERGAPPVVELSDKIKKAGDLGLILQGTVAYDLVRMISQKDKVVATLVEGITALFKE